MVYSYTGANYAANVTNAADGADVSGFYVTNTANNVNAYVNGDGMSTAPGGFAKGDWFKMTVNVVKADDTTARWTNILPTTAPTTRPTTITSTHGNGLTSASSVKSRK